MRIAFCDAYHAGSHAAFSLGWQQTSRHEIEVLTLPARHWKWRMRQAAPYFAHEITQRWQAGERWDAIVVTSMCNLAELRGLLPRAAAALPAIIYMHENQAAYPSQHPDARDIHYPLIQLISCQSADTIWWNSAFNRDSFIAGCEAVLKNMPEKNWPSSYQVNLCNKSEIHHPGVDLDAIPIGDEQNDPPHIIWAARWEHDKDPDTFFAALDLLDDSGFSFRLSVIGEEFRDGPACFAQASKQYQGSIVHWGYQANRTGYLQALAEADIFVSTAKHEFFGITAVEASCAGCHPVLPEALAYPEVFANTATYHNGSPSSIAQSIHQAQDLGACQHCRTHYNLTASCTAMDDAIASIKLPS